MEVARPLSPPPTSAAPKFNEQQQPSSRSFLFGFILPTVRPEAAPVAGIHTAACSGNLVLTAELIRNGANVNAVNRSGRTPLMGAAFNGHEAVVRLLLDSGADVNFRGRDGATALTYSATADRKEVVQLLLERGAHRWIRDRHNQTPYQFALSTNNMPMARLLDQRDIVANLPDEVAVRILGYLKGSSLLNAALVSRRWYRLANDKTLWRTICRERGWTLDASADTKPSSNPWKVVYAQSMTLHANWRRSRFELRHFQGHQGMVHAMHLGVDRLVTAGHDGTVRQWCAKTGTVLAACIDDEGVSPIVAVAPCGPYILATRMDGMLLGWPAVVDPAIGTVEPAFTLPAHDGCASCLAVEGAMVATAGFDGIVRLWKLETPDNRQPQLTFVRQMQAHAGDVYALCMQGTTIVSGGLDATVRVWDAATGRCVTTLTGHKGTVTCLDMDADRIFSGSMDKSIRTGRGTAARTAVWNRSTGAAISTLSHSSRIRAIQYHHGRIAAGTCDALRNIWVWDCHDHRVITSVQGPRAAIAAVRFDDERLVASSHDGAVIMWDFASIDSANIRKIVGQVALRS